MNAIDTNVFVYALDAAEPVKQVKAREFFRRVLTSTELTLVPWQVAVELLGAPCALQFDGFDGARLHPTAQR